MQDISTLITSVGFPIVMCLLLFKYMQDLNAEHKQESAGMQNAINNLNITMQKLIDRLEHDESGGNKNE